MPVNPSDEKTEHDDDKPYILYVLKALVLVFYQINCLQRFPLICCFFFNFKNPRSPLSRIMACTLLSLSYAPGLLSTFLCVYLILSRNKYVNKDLSDFFPWHKQTKQVG